MRQKALSLILISSLVAGGGPTLGQDKGKDSERTYVHLYHPLGTYEDPGIDNVASLRDDQYEKQRLLSYVALGIGMLPNLSQEDARQQSSLSDADKRTIIQTELSRLYSDSRGGRSGSVRVLREVLSNVEPRDADPVDMYDLLRGAYDRFRPEEGKTGAPYEDYGRTVLSKMQALPIFYELLIRLHELRRHDQQHPAQFWEPLISRSEKLLRHELVYLDSEIKYATKLNSEEGDFLATGVMLIMLSTKSVNQVTMLNSIFNDLESKFTITVQANRYLTRTSEWLHTNVLSPAYKPLAYVTAGAISFLALSYFFDFEPGMIYSSSVAKMATPAFSVLVFQRFIGRRLLTGTCSLLDRAINKVAAVLLKDRRGKLSELIEMPREDLRTKCEDFLKAIREKKTEEA